MERMEQNAGGMVDGAVMDLEWVTARLAEQAAESVCTLPGWVSWKPTDFQTDGVRVFDVYRGEAENFCCIMGFRLKLEDPEGVNAMYWQAGSGLGEADGAGRSLSGKTMLEIGIALTWAPAVHLFFCLSAERKTHLWRSW